MLPAWADVLILTALPVILGLVLWLWGGEDPDGTVVHEQGGDDGGGEPGEMTAAA